MPTLDLRRPKVLIICFIIGVAIIVLLHVQFRDKVSYSYTFLRKDSQAGAPQDLAGPQLIGYVKQTFRPGIFYRGKYDFEEAYITVVYVDKKYYAVLGKPEGFLRSLLDKETFPHLATKRCTMFLLGATNDREALKETRDRFDDLETMQVPIPF